MTMNEIDTLRARADDATNHLRDAVVTRDSVVEARNVLARCITCSVEEIARVTMAVEASETAVALAETSKEEAEAAVVAALAAWWAQGNCPPNAIEEGIDALITTVLHAGGEGRGHPSVEQARDAVLMLLSEAIRSAPPLIITVTREPRP